MSVDVTVETVINRPREQVANFVMDPANDMKWIGALKEVRLLTAPPVGTGARVQRIAAFMGRSIEYVLEITDFRPGYLLDMNVRLRMAMIVIIAPAAVLRGLDVRRDGRIDMDVEERSYSAREGGKSPESCTCNHLGLGTEVHFFFC